MRLLHRVVAFSLLAAAAWFAEETAAAPQPSGTQTGSISSPRLRKAIDVPTPSVDQVAWSSNGKMIAIRAIEWNEAPTTPQGLQTPATFKRNVLMVIPDATAANPQF